ncbi:MAG: FAD-dependent oxidoreductase [Burkholderiales bacterium]|nr:FAD-dependent oxidoreductase [Burkholderiales bacterium]
MPAAWAGHEQWRVLETGFGAGMNFLATWRAWKEDPARPRLLHFASIEARPVSADELLHSAANFPELLELARQLARQWYGLLPGFHRMSFEDGHVLLTLCVGAAPEMLGQLAFEADSVSLDGAAFPAKSLARLCRRGTRIVVRSATEERLRSLATCGFSVDHARGCATWDPPWEPRRGPAAVRAKAGTCAVIGAGLAGASVAASLARRGWKVLVVEAAGGPASGASGLPAGLLAPHQSPDDNLLSRLSRAGVRATLCQAEAVLPPDAWGASGVLEHRSEDPRPPPHADDAGACWTRAAASPDGAPAWWHEKAAWIRPRALVRALLQHPAIECRAHTRVRRLVPAGAAWSLEAFDGAEIARVNLVVAAAAFDSLSFLPLALPLHPVRGQVSWSHDIPPGMPAFPLNGNGHFLPRVPIEGGDAWLCGSTYGRGDTQRDERAQDHMANLERLRTLLPSAALALEPQFTQRLVQAWTGVRCASSDRRPLVGPIAPGLWVSTAMGSRGLTFALLCGELVAARLHAEPLPLEKRLADAIGVERVLS